MSTEVPRLGSTLGDFRIEGVVGRGGMGLVYRATQITLGRPVALKVISSALAFEEGFRERFERESRLAASLDHPHVIPVYAAGEQDGVLYIAMRFVEGTDLRALIAGLGRLEPARAVTLVSQVASALDAAHARGLVHRDVKPANVLVTGSGEDEHAYLTDFGLTKRSVSESGLTEGGQWVGTVDYVAPEQLKGDAVDGRADVYALGCVLYEALTGEVPFPRENELAKLWAHISDPPPSVRELVPEVPQALAAVTRRGMSKSPDQRYSSAGELAAAARAAAPTLAGPQPLGSSGALIAGRRLSWPLLAAAAVALVALAMLGGVLLAGGEDEQPGQARRAQPPAGRVVGEPIRVGDAPSGLTVGDGAVWVSNTGDETVSRIDPRRGEVVGSPIPVGEDPRWLAFAGDAVWVSLSDSDSVVRINPRNSTIAARVRVGDSPSGIAVGPASLWVANYDDDTVVRVDPGTDQVIGGPIRVGEGPTSMAYSDGAVWVANLEDDTVSRVDPNSRREVATIRVGDAPMGLTAGEGSVWVSNSQDGTVIRIDPQDNRIISTIRVGRGPAFLKVGDGAAWVPNSRDGTLTRIDARTNRPLGRPVRVGRQPERAAVGEGSIWVSSLGDDAVRRIAPDPYAESASR
jgi:YVTN family beta-propeller protein